MEQAAALFTGEMSVGLMVMSGFLVFFVVERLIRAATGGSGHSHGHDDAGLAKKDDDHHRKNGGGKGNKGESECV